MTIGLIQFNKDFGRFRICQIERAEITKYSFKVGTWYIPKQYAQIIYLEQQKQKYHSITIKSLFRYLRKHRSYI